MFVVWCEGACKLFLLGTALSAADLSRCAAEYSRTVPRRRVLTYSAAPQSTHVRFKVTEYSRAVPRCRVLTCGARPAAPPLVPVSTAPRPAPLPRSTADGTVPA